MSERPSDSWLSIALSVVVHLSVAGLFIWGFWNYKHPPPQPQQLAIEATVVDPKSLAPGTLPTPQPAPAAPKAEPVPPKPEPVVQEPAPQPPAPEPPKPEPPKPEPPKPDPPTPAPPKPDPAALAQQRKDQEQRERQKVEQERVAKEKLADERRAREKQQREDTERKEKAEADRQAREKAEQVAKQKAADDLQRSQRQAELRAQLAAEERLVAAQSSGAMSQYLAQIRGRIERAWIRPASARAGLSCEVRVTQVQGGEVVGVQVGACNGDEAVRQSIEAAAYRASPLPLPSDPALFDRNLVVTFKPEE